MEVAKERRAASTPYRTEGDNSISIEGQATRLAPVIEMLAAQKRLVTGQQKDEEVKKALRGRPPNSSKLQKISHTPTPGTTIERMFTATVEEEKGKKLAEAEQTPNEEVHKGPDTIMANHDWENDMPAEEMHNCSDLNTAQS
ncbi:MAG: hypothetical protein MMC33_009791, partial [Icmadophila ericetorum]|nr:hypothetical protein [Icmadophila ericetorum]